LSGLGIALFNWKVVVPVRAAEKALSDSQKERGGGSPSGLSVARDGHSQAHMDVLVACPEGEPPPCGNSESES